MAMPISSLLEADSSNVEQTLRLFDQFDPELAEAFDDVANLFQALLNSFGQDANEHQDQEEIDAICAETGLQEGELQPAALGRPLLVVSQEIEARVSAVRSRHFSRRVRPMLALQAYRAYMFAATDIRRTRVTAAIGALRVEIEAVALMLMMQGQPELAVEWHHIRDDKQGRSFFGKTKKGVQGICESHDLLGEWNMASTASQHARLAGLVDGLVTEDKSDGQRSFQEYRLRFQDIDAEHPEEFLTRALYILRAQTKLMIPLQVALPEAADPLLQETRIPRFLSKVARLYARLETRFPEYTAKYKRA